MSNSKKVVIVGGGFAGLTALDALSGKDVDVTIVDRQPYTTFQPLLYQVATGGLNPGDITYSLRRLASRRSNAAFRQGTVTGIDEQAKTIALDGGQTLPYDALILACGVTANFFGIDGAEDRALTIYTRGEALLTRDQVFTGLERLASERDPDQRFTVVVVGGGATGVEMAGTLAEMKSEALPAIFPELSIDSFHVVLIEMADRLLTPFAKPLSRYALQQLRKRGVDVRLGTSVKKIDHRLVETDKGAPIDADVVIWATGVKAHDEVEGWGLPQGKAGRIDVEPTLQVKGHPDIFAAGDCAIVDDHPLPQLAQPAIQMGRHAANQVLARFEDRALTPFRYLNKGTMATIGRNAAVVEFPKGPRVTGFPAWALWVVVHLATLLGGRNRVQTMINMAFRYFAWPGSAATVVGDTRVPELDKK